MNLNQELITLFRGHKEAAFILIVLDRDARNGKNERGVLLVRLEVPLRDAKGMPG